MNRLRLPGSLRAKYLLVTLVGLGLAVLVWVGLRQFGGYLIDERYMSAESVSRRKAKIYAEFSAYVAAEGLTGRDTGAVARWTASHDYVTIFLFSTGREQQLYAGGEVVRAGAQGYDPAVHGRLFPVRFADGLYQIAIDDTSQLRQRQLVNVASILAAGLCFLLPLLWYTRRVTRRIIALSRQAALVSSGELETHIRAEGDDEIGRLADSMEEMRGSVIDRMRREQRAWEANTELITAISHDIRTPMTSMIGYLELLCAGGEDEDSARQFAQSAYGKAMELKDLTDQLFRYFLVYGRAELELKPERFDARLLLEQLLGEAEFELADAGFAMQHIAFEGACSLTVDPLYIKRVLDNLVSNIKKYADPSRPVVALSELRGGILSLCLSNAVPAEQPRRESTRIGLRTCEKILAAMGGEFLVRKEEGHFAAELRLPAESGE